MWKEVKQEVKPVKRKFELNPPKPVPRPQPSFSIIKKVEPTFNADVFYHSLLNYALSEEQLVANGYPRPTNEMGVASINMEGRDSSTPLPEPVGENAVRYVCSRCHKPYIVYNDGGYQTVEECVYHYGRLYKSREYGEGVVSQYSCCGERRNTPGCQVAKLHVNEGDRSSSLSGCIKSTPPPQDNYTPQIYAIDCEMCYTTRGLELTRISLIDWTLNTVYESLVKPSHPIVDYNTRFSGLTSEDFVSVTKMLPEVQLDLSSIIYEDTVLIGHSLESDLKALKFIHSTVVDTAIVFPHRKGLPYKRALKSLMAEILHKFIQDSVDGGHDSREDSIACMELMLWKIKSDLKITKK